MPKEPLTKNLQFEKKNKDMVKLPKRTSSPLLFSSPLVDSPPSSPKKPTYTSQLPAITTPINYTNNEQYFEKPHD